MDPASGDWCSLGIRKKVIRIQGRKARNEQVCRLSVEVITAGLASRPGLLEKKSDTDCMNSEAEPRSHPSRSRDGLNTSQGPWSQGGPFAVIQAELETLAWRPWNSQSMGPGTTVASQLQQGERVLRGLSTGSRAPRGIWPSVIPYYNKHKQRLLCAWLRIQGRPRTRLSSRRFRSLAEETGSHAADHKGLPNLCLTWSTVGVQNQEQFCPEQPAS